MMRDPDGPRRQHLYLVGPRAAVGIDGAKQEQGSGSATGEVRPAEEHGVVGLLGNGGHAGESFLGLRQLRDRHLEEELVFQERRRPNLLDLRKLMRQPRFRPCSPCRLRCQDSKHDVRLHADRRWIGADDTPKEPLFSERLGIIGQSE